MNSQKRILAVGDIHGMSTALDELLGWLRPTASDELVFLGDYVSRGPDSRGVIDRLINLQQSHRTVLLRGNHEVMMTAARRSQGDLDMWLRVGGRAAVNSYALNPGQAGRLEHVPAAHWHFLENHLVPFHQTDRCIFVHANLDADVELTRQTDHYLYWEFMNRPTVHCSGKVMVCGHSTQRSGVPLVFAASVCIDTGACAGGWLTCLDVLTGNYWQVDSSARRREGRITLIDS